MASNHGRIELLAEAQSSDDAVEEYGWLSNIGLLELLVCTGKHYICNLETKYFVGLVEKSLGRLVVIVEFLTHTYEL